MKCKMFMATDVQSMEAQLNEFLEKEGLRVVSSSQHAANGLIHLTVFCEKEDVSFTKILPRLSDFPGPGGAH